MIKARSGNGSPASVVSGSASAAASVTAPRSPIHETTAGRCQGGAGSRLSDNPQRNQGTYDNGKIQMIRITITAKPAGNPARRSPDKPPTGLPDREAAGEDGHDRYAVEDERRPVVDQAFALDDRHDPSRHSEPHRDRCRGEGIGRRHDRTEHESR